MGDSLAAGAGLNPHPTSNCDRSSKGYPGLLASHYGLTLDDLACAGASVAAGIAGPQGVHPAQLSVMFGLSQEPSLVTITIGGNDVNWYNAVLNCYLTQCTATSEPSSFVTADMALETNLHEVITAIAAKYSVPPEVIVTSYFNAFTGAYDCSDDKGANPIVLAASDETLLDTLDQTLQQAISGVSFTRFANAKPGFVGHELCTPDPWVQGLSDPAPYHPTAAGQQEFANTIIGVR